MTLTFSNHRDSDGHPHELAFGPHMRVDAHLPLRALGVEARHGGVVGHLLGHEAHLVGLLRGGGGGGGGGGLRAIEGLGILGGLGPPGNLPGAVEGLADDGVVGLLGDGALAALVEGGEVVLHEAHHALLGAVAVSDGHKQVRVRHEVGVHLQQRALLEDEGGQDHLGSGGAQRVTKRRTRQVENR